MVWPPLLQRLLSRNSASGNLPNWSEHAAAAGSHHVVQFYGGEFPAGSVADFLRAGIEKGEVGVMVATPDHCDAVKKMLGPLGRKCRFLHAGRALGQFTVSGKPDEALFDSTVGNVVRGAAAAGNGHVRVYGEMVVILCERGNPDAALALERMWTRLAEKQPLTLLCSYPLDVFSGENRPYLARLRDEHQHHLTA